MALPPTGLLPLDVGTRGRAGRGCRRPLASLLGRLGAWGALAVCCPALGAAPTPAPDPVQQLHADHTLSLRGSPRGRVRFEAAEAGPATLLLLGLQGGGAVTITVNGAAPQGIELVDRGTPAPPGPSFGVFGSLQAASRLPRGRADCALVSAVLHSGANEVEVTEAPGVQVGRLLGSNRWFATSTLSGGRPLFWIDLDILPTLRAEFPARLHYGPQGDGFLWFSARWDHYYGEVYGDRVSRIQGSSGGAAATLSYTVEYPTRSLLMPTQLTFTPEPLSGALTVRVRQVLRAVGETTCSNSLEFLHIKVSDAGAQDWGDGAVDYAWYRSESGDCPDAPPGSHTGMVRLVDTTLRTYAFRSSVVDARRTAVSDIRHTGAAVPLAASSAIGGYFSKTGVGSCGWVFHRYRASFRDDLRPIFSHCGAGADTHFYTTWSEFFNPLVLKAGDKIETEYSLTLLPCEVSREEIEDLNEADLHIFGSVQEQAAPIVAWLGTPQAIGLQREDGSLLLLGLGRQPARVPLSAATVAKAANAYRLFALAEPTYDYLDLAQNTVEVRPGWITVVDCGAALWEPVPPLAGVDYYPLNGAPPPTGDPDPGAGRQPWPLPLTGGPVRGALMRK